MSKTKQDVDAKSTELMKLTIPLKDTAIPQRVQSYVMSKTGKKLAEFIGAPEVTFDEKFALLDELVKLLKSEDYSKFPAAANGQAQAAPAPAAPKVTPKPVAPKITEPEPSQAPAADPLKAAIELAKAKRAAAAAEAAKQSAPTIDEEKVREIVAEVCAQADAELEERIKAHLETRLLEIVQQLAA